MKKLSLAVLSTTRLSSETFYYFSILVGESYSQGLISFEESKFVNSAVWEPLEKLVNGEGWPRSDAYVEKKYEQLCVDYKQWPDRYCTVYV